MPQHRAELGQAVGVSIELFRDRWVFCSGTVNGVATEMMLDSGAGVTVLSEEFAEQLRLESVGARGVQGVGGRQAANWATGVSVQVGNLELDDLRIAILDLSGIEEALGRKLPVILGREVFASCVVDLEPNSRRMTLHAPSSYEYKGSGATVPLIPVNSGWITVLSVNGAERVPVDVDTGSGGNLTIFKEHAREIGLLPDDLPPPIEFSVGVGGRSPVRRTVVDSLSIGDSTLRDVPVQVHEGTQGAFLASAAKGNLGSGLLLRFRTVFDASRQQLHLELEPNGARPFERNRAGVAAFVKDGALEVVCLLPGGPAEKAGWKLGDRIVAIDGVRLDGSDWQALFGWTSQPSGTRVLLTGADGEQRALVLQDPPPGIR